MSVTSLMGKLLAAVKQGDEHAVSSLLEKCSKVDTQQRNSALGILLKEAVWHGQLNVIKLLVENFQVDINYLMPGPSGDKESVLFNAIRWHSDLVEDLVKLGADVNIVIKDGTPLTEACAYTNLDLIQLLLAKGADVNLPDQDGLTPLMVSSSMRNDKDVAVVKYLLDHGAESNLQTKSRRETALHKATLAGGTMIVEELLSKQAKILPDKKGFTPIFVAVEWEMTEIFSVFMNSKFVSKEDKVNALEFKAASLAPRDMTGVYRLLHEAMRKRREDPCSILTKPLCKPVPAFGNVWESQTLEELAARKDNHDMLKMECLAVQDRLLGRGKMCLTGNFYSIWKGLFDAGKYDVAMSLVEYGIEFLPLETAHSISNITLELPSQTTESLTDSMLSAIEKGLQYCIKIFNRQLDGNESSYIYDYYKVQLFEKVLSAIIELNIKDKKQIARLLAKSFIDSLSLSCNLHTTPLHVATQLTMEQHIDFNFSSYKALVDILVECGANINEKNESGQTILAFVLQATESGDDQQERRRQLVELLLEKGASPAYLGKDARLPSDPTISDEILQLLRLHYPLPLKHLVAFVILNNRFKHEGYVPQIMAKFIDGHR